MAGPPAADDQLAREAAIVRAELRFENYLEAQGEAVGLVSLPLVAGEVAAGQAGGNASLGGGGTARPARRARLHAAAPAPGAPGRDGAPPPGAARPGGPP